MSNLDTQCPFRWCLAHSVEICFVNIYGFLFPTYITVVLIDLSYKYIYNTFLAAGQNKPTCFETDVAIIRLLASPKSEVAAWIAVLCFTCCTYFPF